MTLGVVASLTLAACGGDDDASVETTAAPAEESAETTSAPAEESADGSGLVAGSVFVSGSSTVEPINVRVAELAAELSGGALAVTVEGPGTGDGFKKFCAGEADITGGSRAIKDSEAETCAGAGVNYVELEVAIDGLTVATSPNNAAVECLDIPALYALLGPESEGFASWADANSLAGEVGSAYTAFPDAPLTIFGPGEESGTYDTFVEFAIEGLAEERVGEDAIYTRADYSSSANDNFIVEGIEGSDTSLGWVGYAYYKAEQDKMKGIAIDTGDGCVAPTDESIADGLYGFSRSLYIYVNTDKAAENPAVASFVDLYLSEQGLAKVADAGYVDLPADRVAATQAAWTGR
jgi:phosphate transport system substrate-binding protein